MNGQLGYLFVAGTDSSREGPLLHTHDGACAGVQDKARLAYDAVFPETAARDAGLEEQYVSVNAQDPPMVLMADYTFTVDRGADELAWSSSTNGPEDVYDQTTKGPHPDSKAAGTFAVPEPVTDPTKIQIRQERQTLRRLPRTGAIIFTVHSYSEPVTAIAAEPGVPGRLATSIRSWKGEVHV